MATLKVSNVEAELLKRIRIKAAQTNRFTRELVLDAINKELSAKEVSSK